jgi:hypothetical protein
MTQYLLTHPETGELIERREFPDMERAIQFLTKQWGLNTTHQATLRAQEPVIFGTRSLRLFNFDAR